MRTKRKRKTTVAARTDREREKRAFTPSDRDSGKGGTDIEAHCGLGHVGKKLLLTTQF